MEEQEKMIEQENPEESIGQNDAEEQTILTLKIQMKTAYLFDFLFWHSYHGIYGVINVGFSIAALVFLACGFGEGNAVATAALWLLAALFTIINPLLLYRKAASQMKKVPMFQKPLYYDLSEQAFTVRQETESATTEWDKVLLIRETKKNIVLYLGAANAVVLPKEEFSNNVSEVKALIKNAIPEVARKLKK